jgi:hypothetical protein
MEFLISLIEQVWSVFTGRRRLSVKVHRARFIQTGVESYFINIVNLSESRDIEITHVWFDGTPQLPVWQPERPLPKRLMPDEVWETWIEVSKLPADVKDPFAAFRVRLSTGKILKSAHNPDVPPIGTVPGNHNS